VFFTHWLARFSTKPSLTGAGFTFISIISFIICALLLVMFTKALSSFLPCLTAWIAYSSKGRISFLSIPDSFNKLLNPTVSPTSAKDFKSCNTLLLKLRISLVPTSSAKVRAFKNCFKYKGFPGCIRSSATLLISTVAPALISAFKASISGLRNMLAPSA